MRVLSLKQPWASLVVMGAKKWETRSWKPSITMKYMLNTYGMLIHVSAKFDREDKLKCCNSPFRQYCFEYEKLPTGSIIGYVGVGRIISTSQWKGQYKPMGLTPPDEFYFGDYMEGRWAWELTNPVLFETPIPFKGSPSLWEYNGPLPELSTTGKPSPPFE